MVKIVSRRPEAVFMRRNGPGRARTVANRAGTVLTGAVRTGLQSSVLTGEQWREVLEELTGAEAGVLADGQLQTEQGQSGGEQHQAVGHQERAWWVTGGHDRSQGVTTGHRGSERVREQAMRGSRQ